MTFVKVLCYLHNKRILPIKYLLDLLVMDQVSEIMFLRPDIKMWQNVRNININVILVNFRNRLNASWARLFFIFCQISALFDYFSSGARHRCNATFKNHQKWQKFGKKASENPFSSCVQPGHFQNPTFKNPVRQ